MSYVVLARKWRPMSFRDLIGQEHVSRTLANAIARERVAHAFLFTGVRGVGKTTSARILAKALNCLEPQLRQAQGVPDGNDGGVEPCLRCAACKEIAEGIDVDVREIDGASYTGVDEIRKLQESLPYRPVRDRYKIFIVDEVHMLSQNAWNALLKTLEEPPPHVKFILATTEVHKVPVTILSRVQRFDFKMIPSRLIGERVRYVLAQEGIEADDRAVAIVAREAAGSMRDALSLLDQVIAFSPKRLVGDEVRRVLGVAGYMALTDIAEAVLRGKAGQALEGIAELSNQSCDLTVGARDLLGVLRDVTVAKLCKEPDALLDLSDDERQRVKELAAGFDEAELLRVQRGFAGGFDEVSRSPEPRAALEMLLARLALRPALLPLDDLLQRLADLEARLGSGRPPPPAGGGGRTNPGPGGGPPRGGQRAPASAAGSDAPARASAEHASAPSGASSAAAALSSARPTGPSTGTRSAPAAPSSVGVSGVAPSGAGVAAVASSSGAGPVAVAGLSAAAHLPHPIAAPPPIRGGSQPVAGASAAPPVGNVRRLPADPSARRLEAVSPAASAAAALSARAVPANDGAAPSSHGGAVVSPPSAPVEEEPPPLDAAAEARFADLRRVLEVLGQSRQDLVAILKHTTPLVVSADALTLGYEAGNVLETPMRSPECLAQLRDAAVSVFGREPKIVLSPLETRLPTLAETDRRAREREKRAAVDRAERHPSVRDAVEILGARVKRIDIGDG